MSSTVVHTVPWHWRASVWIGIGINPASLTLGAGLAILLPLKVLIPVIAVGAFIVAGLALVQGIGARRRQQNLGQRAAQTFGVGPGSVLLNLLMAIGMLGWGGFHVGISGASVSNLLNVPIWMGTLLITVGVFVLSEMGINRWNAFGWITTLSALALALWALFITYLQPTWNSPTEAYSGAQLFWVLGTVITFAILFALRTPDFTWDLATDADVVKSAISFFLAFLLAATIGALLFEASGASTLDRILSEHQYASIGYVFLIIAVVTPILSVLHSGTLALQSLVPIHQRASTLIICTIVFLLGVIRFDRQLLVFLDWLSVLLPTALFVMLGVLWRGEKINTRWAMVAWLFGATVTLVAKAVGQQAHLIWGAIASIGVMLLVVAKNSRAMRVMENP